MVQNKGRGNLHAKKDLTQVGSHSYQRSAIKLNPLVVLNSLYPTSLIRPSSLLFLDEKGNTMTRKGPTPDLGKQCSFHLKHWTQQAVLHVTELLYLHGPKDVYPPTPVLGCYFLVLLHISILFLLHGPHFAGMPTVLTSSLNHNFTGTKLWCPITFHSNCTER